MADEKMTTSLPMPIKARPYYHQQAGFDFACRVQIIIIIKCTSHYCMSICNA